MPKKAYSEIEIEQHKTRIMDEASHVLAIEGISNLSMRKLAASIGMTAANIYNYFPNKDVLFIETTQRGFILLDEYTQEAVAGMQEPRERLITLLKTAVKFAKERTGYWELMFHPPISLRGLEGTVHEEIDTNLREKTVARMVATFSEIIERYVASSPTSASPGYEFIKEKESSSATTKKDRTSTPKQLDNLAVRVITILTNTHGLIDLYNHRIFDKFGVDADDFVDSLILSSVDLLFPELEE